VPHFYTARNLIVVSANYISVKITSLRKQLTVIRGYTSSKWRHNSDDIDNDTMDGNKSHETTGHLGPVIT
jgi:hypothetical protein